MNKSFQLFALSTTIKNFNSTLSTDIKVIDIVKVEKILDGGKTAAILFEKKHLKQILSICKRRVECKSRLICVGKNLSSDDRLVLLNHNIEFLTPEKFIDIGPYFFEVGLIENQPKVLIVEDDEDQIVLTEHILYNANISVMSISKGEEVLDAIESFNPDLVLMDLFLEGITGDKLVQAIRKVPIHRFLPIVFLTSDNSIESRMRVLNAGADDLLTKPINSDLLVSAIKNRIQRNHLFQSSVKNSQAASIVHNVVELEGQKLNKFLKENKNNPSASIIWLKVKNKHSLLKKLGYSGFKNLCKKMFENIPNYSQEFIIKLELAEGVFVFAADDMDRKTTRIWVERLYKWLSKNYFSIRKKDYYFDISAIILADIPKKNNQDQLLQKAEHILIDGMINQPITFLEEGIEERHFYLVKTQLEKAIKTRNFNWQYQTIVSTQDESQEIYQLMLRVITDTGKELNSSDYLDIANKTGLLRLLDRFTLEHAIRIIRAGEQKSVKTRTLLNQILSDYQSSKLRHKKFEVIKKLKLPLGSMIFQFSKDDAVDYMSILNEVGRELTQTRIKICLSNFDCSNVAWKIARKLNVSWIRLRPFGKDDAILDTDNPNNLSKVIRKAHILGYKVIVSQVDSAGFAAELWKMNIDYLQGNFIQAPIKDVFDSE
jgi:CheY-like chemotaxis protein/EAL domain-containing protein (putative c-di-GMP-specific phosphodiesterase class I)